MHNLTYLHDRAGGVPFRHGGAWTTVGFRQQHILEIALDVAAIALALGVVLVGFVLIARDLRRRSAERAEVERRIAEREKSESRFRSLVEFSPFATVVIDGERKMVLVNSEAESLFGYPREELLGRAIEILMPSRSHDRHVGPRDIDCGNPRSRTIGNGRDVFGRRKDGSEFPIEVSLSPVETDDGVLINTSIRDISGRVKAERDMRQNAEELARSNAELAQFAYVASHDLQEPLRMVGSFTQLLARRYRGRLDTTADEYVAFIVDGVARMQHLINDLLDYARVGVRTEPYSPVDLNAILTQVLANMDYTIAEAGATVTHEPLPVISGSASQLGRLFQNLIANAIKFRGDAPPAIHVAARQDQAAWTFCVSDNGIGIDAEYFPRIFLLFQRLHGRARYPGNGLGLAICKKIVDQHGGRIWVESTPNLGSRFSFTLAEPER